MVSQTKKNGLMKSKRFEDKMKEIIKYKSLLLLLTPGILYYIVFHYIPMYGISIAFIDYKQVAGQGMLESILNSEWVGFENIINFAKSPMFFKVVRNTFLLSFYSILWEFPAPIILAICLNELRNYKYKRIVQTISYLPHFISVVSLVGIMIMILSPSTGYINVVLVKLGFEPIYFMAKSELFRTLYISSGIWTGIGWGAIIYIAAISGIDSTLYEAAVIDGATRIQRIFHITLPMIKPTIIILFILRTGGILSVGTEKVLLMYSPITYETADVIGTYLYRRGLVYMDFSYATAIGLFNSLINLAFLITANYIAKKYSDISLW